MATNGFAAKRAIIAALQRRSLEGGNALSGIQVLYKFAGSKAETVCVYGGGFTFEQTGENDVIDGNNDRVPFETCEIGIHIRIALSPVPDDPEAADAMAEDIGIEIARLFAAKPDLAGGKSVTDVRGGQADYSPVDAADVTIFSLRVAVESYVF